MLNWFYTFYYEKSNSQVIGAISTPSIPGITFSMVREQLIRPYLIKQGISNPVGLTYERAKNAAQRTHIIEAAEITPSININGINHSTLTGYAQSKTKEIAIDKSSDRADELYNSLEKTQPIQPTHPDVSLEELLRDWKQAHKYDSEYETDSSPQIEKDSFVEDGPVDKDIYKKSKIKVLFIL